MVDSPLPSLLQNYSKLLHLSRDAEKPLSHFRNSFPIWTSLPWNFHCFKALQCRIGVWMESRITEALKNWANFLEIQLAKRFLFFLNLTLWSLLSLRSRTGSFFMFTRLHWKWVQLKSISLALTTKPRSQLSRYSSTYWAPAVCQALSWVLEAWSSEGHCLCCKAVPFQDKAPWGVPLELQTGRTPLPWEAHCLCLLLPDT